MESVTIAILCIFLILSIVQFGKSIKLADFTIIKQYVNSLTNEELRLNRISSDDINSLKNRLNSVYPSKVYGYLVIRQAITIAIGNRIKEEKLNLNLKDEENINEIDNMNGRQFELYLGEFFRKKGYNVIVTSSSGDQGVDLIIQKLDRKIAIQAKRYNQNNYVGNTAIQEVLTGSIYYDCTESYVITTSFFTSHAVNLANKVGVRLIDRIGLMKLLKNKFEL